MFKKTILISLLLTLKAFSCPIFEIPVPMVDAYINIDAEKSKTNFDIRWKFKEFYINLLLKEHDKNRNGKFEKAEQEEIKREFVTHAIKDKFFTQIVYVEKAKRIKKSLMQKLNLTEAQLIFSGNDIECHYKFTTNFVLKKDHRLFIRFLDPQKRIYINVKSLLVNNYNDIKVVVPDGIRVNIYFYEYKPKEPKSEKSNAKLSKKSNFIIS